jgi:predicted transcriptional regulator
MTLKWWKKEYIVILNKQKISIRKIAKKLRISPTTVQKYLKQRDKILLLYPYNMGQGWRAVDTSPEAEPINIPLQEPDVYYSEYNSPLNNEEVCFLMQEIENYRKEKEHTEQSEKNIQLLEVLNKDFQTQQEQDEIRRVLQLSNQVMFWCNCFLEQREKRRRGKNLKSTLEAVPRIPPYTQKMVEEVVSKTNDIPETQGVSLLGNREKTPIETKQTQKSTLIGSSPAAIGLATGFISAKPLLFQLINDLRVYLQTGVFPNSDNEAHNKDRNQLLITR